LIWTEEKIERVTRLGLVKNPSRTMTRLSRVKPDPQLDDYFLKKTFLVENIIVLISFLKKDF
jgi:hypothetical protein